jgi:hypothetical protein
MEGLNPSVNNEEYTGEDNVNPMDNIAEATGVEEESDVSTGESWFKFPLLLSFLLLSWLKYL